MWHRIEMTAWLLGAVLQFVLLIAMEKRKSYRNLPFLFLWLICDFCFSAVLYVVNETGGARTIYPKLWDAFEPITAGLLCAAALEQMGLEYYEIGTITAVVAIGASLSFETPAIPHGYVLGIAAMMMTVSLTGLLWCSKRLNLAGWILALYVAGQACEHMAVIWHAPRWHAGAVSQVVYAICFGVWLRETLRGGA
jgi:hypothetical protein